MSAEMETSSSDDSTSDEMTVELDEAHGQSLEKHKNKIDGTFSNCTRTNTRNPAMELSPIVPEEIPEILLKSPSTLDTTQMIEIAQYIFPT